LCLVVRSQHGSHLAFQFGFQVPQDSLFCLVRELEVFVGIQARDEFIEDQHEAFRTKVKIGDLVALPVKSAPAVAFGRITGDYRYVEGAVGALRHQRSVEWINDGVPRDAIDQDLLYSLGAFLTVCRTKRNNAEHRIRALLASRQSTLLPESHPTDSTSVVEPDEVAESAVDLGQLGRDQIRRRLAERFKGHELARLIAISSEPKDSSATSHHLA
jgi:predicted Mrr-cat superfamily restriction endonuclease